MPDYFTLLRHHVTLKCRSIDRIFWSRALLTATWSPKPPP
jgi:hypothetical protein